METPKELIELAFSTDEYDDFIEDEHERHIRGGILKEFFYRNYKLPDIVEVGCGSGSIMLEIPVINYGIEPNENRYRKFISNINEGKIKVHPYERSRAEDANIYREFDTVLCWGSFCYFRSQWEGLINFNRMLKKEGILIFDVATKSNLPIVQTVHGDSFCNMLEKCFGFKIVERREFGEDFNQRLAIAAIKEKEFDYHYLQIPFLKKDGKVGNFLLERDWYLG
jgi:SAM-dependent methyltransferase